MDGDGREKRTICNLMRFPSSSMVRILKSIPIVVMKDGVQASSQKRRRRQDLPTPGRRMRMEARWKDMEKDTRVADEKEL